MSKICATPGNNSPISIAGVLAAASVLALTLFFGGVFLVGAIVGSVSGAVGAVLHLIYERTGKEWLAAAPLILIGLGAISSKGSLLVGFPQSFAVGYLSMCAVAFAFHQFFPGWSTANDS